MLTLEIFDDGGVFRHHNNYDGIVAELDDVLEQREAGTVTPAKYVKTLKALVGRCRVRALAAHASESPC